MTRSSAVLQLRLDARLKDAFVEAARAQDASPSEAMRSLIAGFVRESHRRQADLQSRRVATAPDAEATMDDMMRAQANLLDD